MKNKKIMSVIIGILILISSIFYRNSYIVKNNKQIIKEMDENTQVSSLNNTINELNRTHEEYQAYIQNCKAQIATALTNEGVTTSSDARLETMASNISKILQARTSDATATEEDIVEGKTAYVKGELITGNARVVLPNITMKYGIHVTGGWVYADIPVPAGYKTVEIYTQSGSCSVTILDSTQTLAATKVGTYDVSQAESVYVRFSGPGVGGGTYSNDVLTITFFAN